MDSIIITLQEEFIRKKWEVQAEVPIKIHKIFDYKIPLIVKQKQLEYRIFYIPHSAESIVINAIVDATRGYNHDEIIILAMLHPRDASRIDHWLHSRVALTTNDVWNIISNDVKLHKYQKELQEMRDGIDEINTKIKVLEQDVKSRF